MNSASKTLLMTLCGAMTAVATVATAGAPTAAQPAPQQPGSVLQQFWDRLVPPKTPPAEALHDPTQPGPLLREIMDSNKLQPKTDLPPLELKGRVIGGLLPAAAMLGIDKQLYLVREGEEILVRRAQSGPQTLRVIEVTARGVRLEILPLKQSLMLY